MTKLSVNINKIATLRNARGGNVPDVLQVAKDCERFGADGITVHPRPDERHIRYSDVFDLQANIKTELNIEGNPVKKFINLIEKTTPTQVTLVPDAIDALTSNAGWNCIDNQSYLKDLVQRFQELGCRVSIFVGTELDNIEAAAKTGTDRIELYTEPYAAMYRQNPQKAVASFVSAAGLAKKLGLKVNAGHDLSFENLEFFVTSIPFLAEVSIGHALIADALYLGLEKTITDYKLKIEN
ncbi:MAG: pyridoxine 5'-phosphate synthase [Prevotellaceae bacterium]|jgi:pyridoxine 5-phosphate synthase|nr:pyridoxine 5'-phosphate synthase [Prevotellaceae bacterium]